LQGIRQFATNSQNKGPLYITRGPFDFDQIKKPGTNSAWSLPWCRMSQPESIRKQEAIIRTPKCHPSTTLILNCDKNISKQRSIYQHTIAHFYEFPSPPASVSGTRKMFVEAVTGREPVTDNSSFEIFRFETISYVKSTGILNVMD